MASEFGLSYGIVPHTVVDVLQYCKDSVRRVLRALTEENTAAKIMACLSFLQHYTYKVERNN
jgi:hypothetical protein